MMKPQEAAARLAATADAIRALVAATPAEQVRWKPAENRWSVLEVVNHLADEEREDFRTRLDFVLHRPGEPWPPIDPEGWVAARRYAERVPGESLDRFLRERGASLRWLATLDADSDGWANTYTHPRGWTMSATTLLAAWVAHDVLHVRQLARLQWDQLSAGVRPATLEYAGTW